MGMLILVYLKFEIQVIKFDLFLKFGCTGWWKMNGWKTASCIFGMVIRCHPAAMAD